MVLIYNYFMCPAFVHELSFCCHRGGIPVRLELCDEQQRSRYIKYVQNSLRGSYKYNIILRLTIGMKRADKSNAVPDSCQVQPTPFGGTGATKVLLELNCRNPKNKNICISFCRR